MMEQNLTPAAPKVTFGECEGETCWRDGCKGIISQHDVENCSCHINPPCGACTSPREYCLVCSWAAADEDDTFNDHTVKYTNKEHGIFGGLESWKPRPLDPRKLDYHNLSHSNSSMIKRGVYPPEMTSKEVEEKIKGTFGGRFNYFGNGKFEYVAYTD